MAETLSEDARVALEGFLAATVIELPLSARERGWERAVDRARQPRPARWVALGATLAMASALAVVMLVPRSATVRPSDGARWQRRDDVVELSLGRLRLQAPRQHLRVVTPQLEVEAYDAEALVDVTSGQTVLSVDEGEVVYRTAAGEWRLKAGERVVINDSVDALAVATPAAIASCQDADVACLEKLASGNGLGAELALFKLGLLARQRGALTEATAAMQEYARRFPDGTFAPEVSIALMLSLQAAGDASGAKAESERFIQRFPREPRVTRVKSWRAHFSEAKP